MSATATGGVRNLRAIFENKSVSDRSYSPSSRGRSSSGSAASASSRPVSSVRTSFIAVNTPVTVSSQFEKTSGDTTKMAGTRDESSNIPAVADDALPASPHQTTHPIEGGLGVILKGSSFEGHAGEDSGAPSEASAVVSRATAMVERIKSNEKPGPPPTVHLNTTTVHLNSTPTAQPIKPPHPKHISPRRAGPSPTTAASPPSNRLPIRGGPTKILGVIESAKHAREAREAAKQEQTNKSTTAADPQPETASENPTNTTVAKVPLKKVHLYGGPTKFQAMKEAREAAREAARQEQAHKSAATADAQPPSQLQPQPSTKAPVKKIPLRGGPAKILGVQESAKHAQEAREAAKQEQISAKTAHSRRLPAAATATTAARDSRNATAASAWTQKPAPKSRLSVPSKLPSAATAKTAASTAKTETERSDNARQSTSRVSLTGRPTKVPAAATAVTASTLAKQATRPSLNGDQGKSRPPTAKPDDSFLARMSRPTVASASKTHDKIEAKSPVHGGKAVKTIPKTGPASSRSRASDQSEAAPSEGNEEATAAELAIEPAAESTASNGHPEHPEHSEHPENGVGPAPNR